MNDAVGVRLFCWCWRGVAQLVILDVQDNDIGGICDDSSVMPTFENFLSRPFFGLNIRKGDLGNRRILDTVSEYRVAARLLIDDQ